MMRALGVLGLAVTLSASVSACGSGSSGGAGSTGGSTASGPTCASLVGQPVSKAFDASGQTVTCIDQVTRAAPTTSQSGSCYPHGTYDKNTPLRWFIADNGFYFGKTGGPLHFKSGNDVSVTQMSAAAGCT